MTLLDALRAWRRDTGELLQTSKELLAGIANQSNLLDHKFDRLIETQQNSSNPLTQKLVDLVAAIDNQTDMLNRKFDQVFVGEDNQSDLIDRKLEALVTGTDNQTALLNRKLDQLFVGETNQSDLIDRKIEASIAAIDNQTTLLNRKFDQLFVGEDKQSDLIDRKLEALIAGIDNQTALLNRKFDQLFVGENNQSDLINQGSKNLIETLDNQSDLLNRKLGELIASLDNLSARAGSASDKPEPFSGKGREGEDGIDAALARLSAYNGRESVAAYIFDQILEVIRPHHRSMFWGDRLLTLDKTAGFRDDPAFQRAIGATSSSTGSNQYASPDGIAWRFNTLVWAARQALSVAGDFVECGVYEGDMSWVVTEMVDLPAAGRHMHLFDTFAGFASEYSSQSDYPECPEFFERADRDYKRPEIYAYVQQRFAAKPYVFIHRGVVPDSLVDAPPVISFLHLDMNSPGPESAALEVLYDRVSPGGIIIFDDYGWVIHKKQKQTADEFMSAKGLYVLELPTGQGMVIKPV